MNTKAALLAAARGAVSLESLPVRELAPAEVLLRMEACGICHSDLYVGTLEKLPLTPLTIGHEGIGRIEAVGDGVTDWQRGDRAGMTFLATTCGACDLCLSGRERLCAKQLHFGYSLHGVLSEYAIVPAAALVRVPAGPPAASIAPLCCAGWTAYGALRQAGLSAGQSVALFGFGGLGHLALQMARLEKLRTAVADISEAKLEDARAAGADMALPADTAGRTLQKEAGGMDAAIVFTPNPAAIQQAVRSLKRGGTAILVGISVTNYELPLAETIVKAITIRGSYLGTREDLEQVFALATAGHLKPQVETHSIEETPALLERLRLGQIPARAVIAF
jgi:alcohol dehydrogenase, propanol-preferring